MRVDPYIYHCPLRQADGKRAPHRTPSSNRLNLNELGEDRSSIRQYLSRPNVNPGFTFGPDPLDAAMTRLRCRFPTGSLTNPGVSDRPPDNHNNISTRRFVRTSYDTVFWTQIPSVKDFMRAYVALRGFTRLCACLHGHALHCAPLIVLAVSCTSQCLRRVNSYRLPAKSIYFHLLAFARSCSHFCICNRILTTRKTSQDRARPHLTLTT